MNFAGIFYINIANIYILPFRADYALMHIIIETILFANKYIAHYFPHHSIAVILVIKTTSIIAIFFTF